MAFMRKDPSEVFADLQTMLGQFWHAGLCTGPFDGQDWAPLIEVVERRNCYVVCLELPGVALEDVDVTCTASQLTVRGHKTHPTHEQDQQPLVEERRYGSFCRTIPFAEAVVADAITARLARGVLEVVAPKKVISAAQAISVRITDDEDRSQPDSPSGG